MVAFGYELPASRQATDAADARNAELKDEDPVVNIAAASHVYFMQMVDGLSSGTESHGWASFVHAAPHAASRTPFKQWHKLDESTRRYTTNNFIYPLSKFYGALVLHMPVRTSQCCHPCPHPHHPPQPANQIALSLPGSTPEPANLIRAPPHVNTSVSAVLLASSAYIYRCLPATFPLSIPFAPVFLPYFY